VGIEAVIGTQVLEVLRSDFEKDVSVSTARNRHTIPLTGASRIRMFKSVNLAADMNQPEFTVTRAALPRHNE